MRTKVDRASALALAATAFAALISADTGVAAQARIPALLIAEPQPVLVSEPVVQPLPETVEAAPEQSAEDEVFTAVEAASLAELVAAQPRRHLSRELECLAGAIYFEAKGESLTGQLAVGRVIVARSRSGRFPASYCGVVLQPSQFSFVRGRAIPDVNRSSPQWQRAAAIARIAHADAWDSPVEGALFFHAAHVSPRWRLTRMARVENHVFYR
ncbi:MAG TPA: cell wall hydrolase [Novosphingobium sp.]|nr:cell wall hydrolase [Novosphingobium sp.]HMP55215.1 cell wall hydrolase [Novosphingobium sp.]